MEKQKKMKKTKFDNSLGSCLKNFWTDYTGWGRATRSEYWWASLFYVALVGTIVSFSNILSFIWFLVTIVPFTCLTARRLHDTNHSAKNILWMPTGLIAISTLLSIPMMLLFALGVPLKPIFLIWLGLFTPAFWVSMIGSLILLCKEGDKKTNKYGKPRI